MFLKNSRAVNDIQGYVIFGQIAPILRQKEIFSENNKDYFFLSIVPHHATKRQRDRQKVNHENCPERNFFGKLTNITLVSLLYPIILYF